MGWVSSEYLSAHFKNTHRITLSSTSTLGRGQMIITLLAEVQPGADLWLTAPCTKRMILGQRGGSCLPPRGSSHHPWSHPSSG